MPLYEYECPNCGRYDRMMAFGKATATDKCRICGSVSERRFSLPHLQTDTNNPLRNLGRILKTDTTSRADAKRALDANGLVMADQKDFDYGERKAAESKRCLDAKIEECKRQYARLPKEAREIDGKKAIAQANAAAAKCPNAKLVRV